MSEGATEQYYQNPNNKAKGTYLAGWSPADWWVFGITLLATTTAWVAVSSDSLGWGWALLISLCLLLNAHVEYARMYKELSQLFEGAYIALILHDRLWEAESTGNRVQRFLRSRRYRLNPDRQAVLPLSHHFVEAMIDGKRLRFGVLAELDTDTGYMGVISDGSAYGEHDLFEQQRVHAELSKAINSFFGTADRRVGVTELRMERPADLTTIDKTVAESGDPFMFYADGLPSDVDRLQRRFDLDDKHQRWAEFRFESFNQLKPTLRATSATRSWQVLIISFKWKDVVGRAIGGKLDSQQIVDLPLIELALTLNQEISSIPGLELQNPHVMNPIEMAEFTRCGLVPGLAATEQYYHDKALGLIPSDDDELEVVTPALIREQSDQYSKSDIGTILTDLRAWPEHRIIVKSDRILIDDTWFMVVRFTKTPEVEHPTRAQQIHFAHPPGEWGGHAEVSERTSGSIDTNLLMTKETAFRSFEEHRSRRKMVVNPNIRRRQRLADMGLEQVSLASTNQRYLPVSHLTAPYDNPRLLDKRFKAYRVVMKQQGISIVKVKGRARMLSAVITAVLGVNRL